MSFASDFEKNQNMPPVTATIIPLNGPNERTQRERYVISTLIDYEFSSSMLIPASSFRFSFNAPQDTRPVTEYISEGDQILLSCRGVVFATCLIEEFSIETLMDFGDRVTVQGRDLMGQWEDQDAITLNSKAFFTGRFTLEQVFNRLKVDTRISKFEARYIGRTIKQYFATEPGESKLTALTRFLEPINSVAWMLPNGIMRIGKPAFDAEKAGDIIMSRDRKTNNVFSARVNFGAGRLPNACVPIYIGQDNFVDRAPQGVIINQSRKCNLLFQRGHRLIKALVTSVPNGASAQDAQNLGRLTQAGGSLNTLSQQNALRIFARANVGETIVQCVTPTHLNAQGQPYMIDTVYFMDIDRASIRRKMYLYEVSYTLDEANGQRTNLFFCDLGTIVAGGPTGN